MSVCGCLCEGRLRRRGKIEEGIRCEQGTERSEAVRPCWLVRRWNTHRHPALARCGVSDSGVTWGTWLVVGEVSTGVDGHGRVKMVVCDESELRAGSSVHDWNNDMRKKRRGVEAAEDVYKALTRRGMSRG